MKNKVCCCFGHREIYKDIYGELEHAIENLIVNEKVKIFMTGGMGEFDKTFASVVRKIKIRYKDISLILVKPYFSGELNTNKKYYESMYDDVIIPDTVLGIHPKAAITKRNRWLVENSDIIISFVHRDYGGAFEAVKYANRLNKRVINIYDSDSN